MTFSDSFRPVVLVVEDESLLRMMAVDLVEEAGFEALEAADADEAVRILESRLDIRLVFTDIQMPGSIDGLKLAACVRDRWPPVHIIVTSGHIARDDATLPEAAEFIEKPYQPRAVAAMMQRMMA